MAKKIELPNLPRGEGSMSWMPDGKTIIYKKMINKKRCSVYGKTPQECMKEMKAKENKSNTNFKKTSTGMIILEDAIKNWHKTFKSSGSILKESSYDREYHTINNQIIKYDISKMYISAITDGDIQEHIKTLINEPYSYSTIKKTYELLRQFFAYYYIKTPLENPMNSVVKPTKSAMNVKEKEIDFFDDEDIALFTSEAKRTFSNGKPVYRLGYGLIAILYTGLRIGEVLGLHWTNINFEKNTLSVIETSSIVIDKDVQDNTENKNTYKVIYTSPKTKNSTRVFTMTQKAREAFLEVKKIQSPKQETDFIFATSTGAPMSARNIRRLLNNIQDKACMKVTNSGMHVLRHTFVSLACRKGIDKKIIAQIVGQNGTTMIERIYQHVTVEEKEKAIVSIDEL